MPIATEFELTFGCGHVGTIDLSALPADRRGGRLDYLKDKGLCGDCFEATREKRRELDRKNWATAKRKDEDATAAAWATRDGYAPLDGSAKQAAFANRVRYDLMRQLYEWAVQEEHDRGSYERVEVAAKAIDTARWWLDQRSLVTTPRDLVELLDVAGETHAGQNCENSA
jgi:hypothetical protein